MGNCVQCLSVIDNEATSGKGTAVSMGIRRCTVSKVKARNHNISKDSGITPFHIRTSKCIMLLEVTIAVGL
jgi:hypothetical protein